MESSTMLAKGYPLFSEYLITLFSKEDNYQLYSFEKLFDHGKIKEFEDRATALIKFIEEILPYSIYTKTVSLNLIT